MKHWFLCWSMCVVSALLMMMRLFLTAAANGLPTVQVSTMKHKLINNTRNKL